MSSQETPATPEPPPEIPGVQLIVSLLLPPLATAAAFGSLFATEEFDSFLGAAGFFSLWMLGIGFLLFSRAVSRRYRGRSLFFLDAFFLMGQLVVCSCVCAVFFLYLIFDRL
jgi:hypothetical protein